MTGPAATGDDLVRVLATLPDPHRLRVVAALAGGRNYVSGLARELGISRALLQVHPKKLEAAGLVSSRLELSDDGKAMKFYEVRPFEARPTPEGIVTAVRTLSDEKGLSRDVERQLDVPARKKAAPTRLRASLHRNASPRRGEQLVPAGIKPVPASATASPPSGSLSS